MAKLIFLGTASAVAYQGHENTFLVLQGEESSILVDCSSRPVMRLKDAGIDHNSCSIRRNGRTGSRFSGSADQAGITRSAHRDDD